MSAAISPVVQCLCCGRDVPDFYVRSRMVLWRLEPGGWCVYCEGDANQRNSDRTRQIVAEVRSGSSDDQRQKECVKELRMSGHPDVEGLLRAVRERLDRAEAKPKAKRSGL